MFPVLQVGPLAVQTYLLALLIGVWAGLALGSRAGRWLGLDGDHVYNLGLIGILGGLAVGRLAHVITFWNAYRTDPLSIFELSPRAFVPWAAVAGGLVVAGLYVVWHSLPWAGVLDALAPAILLSTAIANVGAFLAGRNVGAPSQVPWAITLWGVGRHPAQLYEALATLIVLVLVLRVLQGAASGGTAAWVAILGYGLTRWLLEPFSAASATTLGGLRVAQVAGLAAALVALWALRARSVSREEPHAPAPETSA